MVHRRSTQKQRTIRRKINRARRDRLHTPKEISFKKSLAHGAPVHQAIAVAFPEITTAKQAGKKLEELKKNPLLSDDIKTSQERYMQAISEEAEDGFEHFIAKEEVGIVKFYRNTGPEHRHKAQKSLDSMKSSSKLNVQHIEKKSVNVHINAIGSEEEREYLLRKVKVHKIDNESFDTENQSE